MGMYKVEIQDEDNNVSVHVVQAGTFDEALHRFVPEGTEVNAVVSSSGDPLSYTIYGLGVGVTPQPSFIVQQRAPHRAWTTRWRFATEAQAVAWYNGLNAHSGWRKRLINTLTGEVLAKA